MKVFIVFVGLFIAGISVLVYNGDMINYMHEQALLKATAEECAAGAALLLDEEAFFDGHIVFKQAEGRQYAQEHLSYIISQKGTDRSYDVELSFEDDAVGYATDNAGTMPTVTAVITVTGRDWFRLPVLSVCKFTRSARYELKDEVSTDGI